MAQRDGTNEPNAGGGERFAGAASTTGSKSAALGMGASGKRPLGSAASHRSAEEVRRSGLNMEKMIKKNVMVASRPGGMKKRGLAVVEYFKNRSKQQQETSGASASVAAEEADDRHAKRRKTAPSSHADGTHGEASPASAAAASTAAVPAPAVAASSAPLTGDGGQRLSGRMSLSPSHRPPSTAAAFADLLASPQRHHHGRSNPLHLVSPARGRAAAAINLSSPARPPRGSQAAVTMTSPMRAIRNGTIASPLRRPGQFLASPARPRRTTASPRKPLFQGPDDEDHSHSTIASRPIVSAANGEVSGPQRPPSAPVLESALEQIERNAASSKAGAAISKSPFQSFQSKYAVKPRQGPSVLTSPSVDSTNAQHQPGPTRTGPTIVGVASPRAEDASIAVEVPPIETIVPKVHAKPARALFASKTVVANRSMCFSTEGVASSVDVSPDGEIVVVGFTDGSVRLYEMDSNVPSDRHGYLLGHIDEESNQGTANANLRVKITPDGRYIFVGCRTGPRLVMSINLHHYRNEKDEDDFEQFQKSFLSDTKVRGFADATSCSALTNATSQRQHSYYLMFGLGIGTLRIWQFIEGRPEPEWKYLYAVQTGGNTATTAAFLASEIGDSLANSLTIACIGEDKNLRVWPLEYSNEKESGSAKSDEEENEDAADDIHGGIHIAKSHYDIPNTKDIVAIFGHYAYGISLVGEAYRLRIPLNGLSPGSVPRQSFDAEKFDHGGSGKSRRSKTILESVSASEDGSVLIAVSTEGVLYYTNHISTDAAVTPTLKMIGKNSSQNQQYKMPMKVYIPQPKRSSTVDKNDLSDLQSMMAVVCNPSEDDDCDEGFFNVDPTDVFAARWMVPSQGRDCWVCGVRNTCHWQAPTEQQHKTVLKNKHTRSGRPFRPGKDDSDDDDRASDRGSKKRAKTKSSGSNSRSQNDTPTGESSARPTSTPSSDAKRPASAKARSSLGSANRSDIQAISMDRTRNATPRGRSRKAMSSNASTGDDSDGSAEHSSNSNLAAELVHYKERLSQIEIEWKRRLKGEIQMRRLWKSRETEFNKELKELLEQLYQAEQQVETLQAAQKDAEKRFSFEKLKAEQQSSVRVRYEQLCEEMGEKMALVEDQRRLLEQTTRSLLVEVDRNVSSLKNAVSLERSECIVCKDKQAVTAIVPCGHLCFCEEDGEAYRRNATGPTLTCPICQRELISLLRIY